MTTARALCLAMLFVAAAPAARAQSSDAPPPPPTATPRPPPYPPPSYQPPSYQPPPPPGYVPPPPQYRPRRAAPYLMPEEAPQNTARASAGFAFANDGYDCWYAGGSAGFGYYGCGYGYGYAWPNVNVEVDLGVTPLLAVSIGGNVFWGTDNTLGVDTTVWEPHVDLLFRSSPYSDIRGRLRVGVGLYVAHASVVGGGGTYDDTGAAFRIGAGLSFFSRSRVGIGIDGIFESGSIAGNYVSDFHLLMGPELHF